MSANIRWGIVGLGSIAHTFAKDLALVQGGTLTAIASRSLQRSAEFGAIYGVKHVFGSYDELFASNTVDVIYIASTHNHHEALSIAAMNHGKHVLCEKPLGVNLSQVKNMIACAKRNKVFFMEALWSRFNPSIQKVAHLVESGAIGKIGYLHADFAFYALERKEDSRLLNPDLAGGSLLDIGVYPIFLSYLLLGFPKKIQSASKFYKTGVEIQTAILFDYEEAQAMLYSGLTSKSEMRAEIAGSKGSIYIHPRWHETQGFSMEIDGETETVSLPTIGKGYTYEIQEVHQCLNENKLQSDLWSHQNSLDLITLLDMVRAQNDIKFTFE